MNLRAAENASNLERYSLPLIPATTALDNPRVTVALKNFVTGGGVLIITPFTAYTDENGIFRGDGFAANLGELTGGLVRTIRWMKAVGTGTRKDPEVEWKGGEISGTSPVGLDGYCEFMEVGPEANVIATFQTCLPRVYSCSRLRHASSRLYSAHVFSSKRLIGTRGPILSSQPSA